MLAQILARAGKITRVSNAVAAGQSDIECTILDSGAFDRTLYIVGFGAITAGAATSINVEQGEDSGLSDAADLAGSDVAVADDDDDKLAYLDIGVSDRYQRLVINRATQNSVVDFALAIQYNSRSKKVTHDTTTVLGGEVHPRPLEGTK